MKSIAAFLLPALAAATPLGINVVQDLPNPSDVQITSVSTSGNGCPQGSVSYDFSPDRTIVTLGFDSFQTYIGPGTKAGDHTKNCQIHVNLRYPAGFTFSVVESTYHGFAQLDPGVTGSFFSTYYFSQNAGNTVTTTTTLSGGGSWAQGQVYTKQDTVPTTAVVWCPCGANGLLNVNNRISLSSSNSNAAGSITDDDATIAFTQQIHFSWQRCNK